MPPAFFVLVECPHEATTGAVRVLKSQIATLETCVLPDGTEKRGVEVTFRKSAEGGIRCKGCADGERTE